MDESREASFTKKAVAFRAYSSLIKDFQDVDNSWSFPLIPRGEWQHGQGTALHWGTGDVLLSQSRGMRGSPAPCSSQCPSQDSRWDWDLCRSRNPSSSSSHTCCPFASAKGFLLDKDTDLPCGLVVAAPQPIFPLFHPQGWPQCWKVDEGFPLGATQPLLTLLGSVPRAVGCGFASGMVLLSCWWAALLIQIPFLSNWSWIHGIFICLRVRFCENTSRNPFCSQVESFPTAMCFLCKCTWWPWSHLNPCAHLTCSLVLFFFFFDESEVKSKASLRITEKEFHMC